jgi:hypothetical protein
MVGVRRIKMSPRGHASTIGLAAMASSLLLAACAAPPAEIDVQATVDVLLATAQAEDTSAAPEASTETPTATEAAQLSFEAELYQDATAGFEFDYPASWVVGPIQQYSRGGVTPFTSWERPADVLPEAAPPGETRLDATVQLWDPTGDLDAFLAQRAGAWEASGIAVLSEERWSLEDGRPAAGFVVEGSDGAQAYFFFTTIGDKYLVLSGEGNLALLAEIAHTVRPVPLGY